MGFAAAAAVVGVAFKAKSHSEAKKSDKFSRLSKEAQGRQDDVESLRARRKQLRESRIREANIAVSAESSGVQGSSVSNQALGSVRNQLVNNLGFMAGSSARGEKITELNQKAADASSRSRVFSQLGSTAFAVSGEV